MSSTSSYTSNELSCPNCGASYALPSYGNFVTCEYCGSRFLIPESVRTAPALQTPTLDISSININAPDLRWVRWLVIFIVVVTVVPIVCSLVATVCGIAIPFLTFFVR